MFVYLSKKIAIPHNTSLNVLSWNCAQGWIACGGEKGLLKVLKLESGDQGQPGAAASAASSNLSMNQTLEGHQGNILVVTWNENFRKLTTSDQNGLIIVWMLHRGMWLEEMINNRNKSVVRDMKWTSDGNKICIVYEDGAVIVGTVDGQRLWGKELKVSLAKVEWSPDGKCILFATNRGEVHVYDSDGVYSHKVNILCLDADQVDAIPIASICWHEGGGDGSDTSRCSLAVAFENGRVQLMRSEADDKPLLIDTAMRVSGAAHWNPAGTVLAIAGVQTLVGGPGGDKGDKGGGGGREANVVQFYSNTGLHLRSLRVPGSHLRCLSWEGTGLRLALAVDSFIFFGNIRPQYQFSYFSHTLVYAYAKNQRERDRRDKEPEFAVVFWDTTNDERYTKYVKKLIHIAGGSRYCCLATRTEDSTEQHILIICDDIGSPVQSQYVGLDPQHMCMTDAFVFASSEDVVYAWHYAGSSNRGMEAPSANFAVGGPSGGVTSRNAPGRWPAERVFHVDEALNGGTAQAHEKGEFQHPGPAVSQDPVACLGASEDTLIVARESGAIQRYAVPELILQYKFLIKCRPQMASVNCNSTRLAVLDINGTLSVYCIDIGASGSNGAGGGSTDGSGGPPLNMGDKLPFERKDVWDIRWASDNPDLFAIMEKTRMYVVRGSQPEEPILSNGYICSFKDLKIQSVLMDEVMKTPEAPKKDVLLELETKSLRDTRDIVTKVSNLKDALAYVDQNPHPRLWRLLAEAALDHLDLSVAEKAFVRHGDYQGIQFIKRLRVLEDTVKQKAEIAAYFTRFDEAEQLYRDIDRKDLALDLRIKLGDWFRVLHIAQSGVGGQDILQQAFNEIGNYYADRTRWGPAAQNFAKAGNVTALINAYYLNEDFAGLKALIPELPPESPLLITIGNHFTAVGQCEEAVSAFIRYGDTKAAVDACVLLNNWDVAVQLAEQHEFPQIEGLLSKYAKHLLGKNKKLEACQLFRRAERHAEAAKLLVEVAEGQMPGRARAGSSSAVDSLGGLARGDPGSLLQGGGGGLRNGALPGPIPHPDRLKKLYLLASLEVEKLKAKSLNVGGDGTKATGVTGVKATLDSLVTADQAMSGERLLEKDSPWRGAEAHHLYMLVHRLLLEKKVEGAMRAALHLSEYEDQLGVVTVWSLVALCCFYNRFYLQCSRAFTKLEASQEISEDNRSKYEELALSIFTKFPPQDPQTKKHPCPRCQASIPDIAATCRDCGERLKFCCATGRTLFIRSGDAARGGRSLQDASGEAVYRCRECKHFTLENEVTRFRNCPFCHAPVGV
uniref:Uncharacterized protein n=1 Tax=Chromera velia CCMP2878 TaxID=1169474 RepID=A0A0G4GH72_9ALVE|eukprot:Cvel_21899.t1-p1 / transcript=Cvel_21899.t1 / gene=Cvel_21899 / organism=Chromera_velia_CCMP2878 / gene_product=WD repeat-containing protein 35, putative / transcript_product=WD repeat-containing protein 35, putative / location=Cvel_scaffold2097:15642-29352(+) / protein_length=1293 / sequence_SO=supercontig / SO=protein_coding / is_pseudo=false